MALEKVISNGRFLTKYIHCKKKKTVYLSLKVKQDILFSIIHFIAVIV